jgi:FtsX-like permease family
VRIIAGRDFTDDDGRTSDELVIVSQSLAQRMFPSVEAALNHGLMWTDSNFLQFGGVSGKPRRIVGVVADIDDANLVPKPVMTVYSPGISSRLFVRTRAEDPYTLVPSITRIIRQMSADQPVERAATLEDVRAEVLTPDRLNALVFGGFALVALTIAIVGVAGVLAFSVSARLREFGIRLAIGSAPRNLLARVLGEGAVIAGAGIMAGALGGVALMRVASGVFGVVRMPGVLPIAGAATLLLIAAVLASLLPLPGRRVWMPSRRCDRIERQSALAKVSGSDPPTWRRAAARTVLPIPARSPAEPPKPEHGSDVDEAPERLAAQFDGKDRVVEDDESRQDPLLAIPHCGHYGQDVKAEAAQKQPQQHVVAERQRQQAHRDSDRGNHDNIG